MQPIGRHPRFRIRGFIGSSGTAVPLRGERAPPNSASSCLPSQVSNTWISASETRRERSISNSTDQPASLSRFLRRPVAGRRGGRAAFRSTAIFQPAVRCARAGSRSGAGGLLRGRWLCGRLHRPICRWPAVKSVGMFHRESGLFDHGDRRRLGVSAGQSPGELRAPVFRGCGFGLLCAIQRQTGRKKRLYLGAIDDEPGFVAGAACGYIGGMAIEPGSSRTTARSTVMPCAPCTVLA